MEPAAFISPILTALVGAIVGYVVWRLQHGAQNKATRAIEEFKGEKQKALEAVKSGNATTLEQVKAELESIRADIRRREVRVTEYDRKQAEILADLYPRLVALRRDANKVLDWVLSKKETQDQRMTELKGLESRGLQFVKDVNDLGVFLPESLDDDLAQAGGRVRTMAFELERYERTTDEGHRRQLKQDVRALQVSIELDGLVKKLKVIVRDVLSGGRQDRT